MVSILHHKRSYINKNKRFIQKSPPFRWCTLLVLKCLTKVCHTLFHNGKEEKLNKVVVLDILI